MNVLEKNWQTYLDAQKEYISKSVDYLKTILNVRWLFEFDDLTFYGHYETKSLSIHIQYDVQRKKFIIDEIITNKLSVADDYWLKEYTEKQVRKILKRFIKLENFQ